MMNEFIKTIENDIKAAFVKQGAILISLTQSEAIFSLNGVEISICLDREIEVYATIQSDQIGKKVYLSEILSNYLDIEERGIYQISNRFTVQMGLRRIADIITAEIVPLIFDRRIDEVINSIIRKREEGLGQYYENIAEKEAGKAFNEKRYDDVILYYSKIKSLTDIQKKRLKISQKQRGQ